MRHDFKITMRTWKKSVKKFLTVFYIQKVIVCVIKRFNIINFGNLKIVHATWSPLTDRYTVLYSSISVIDI